MEVTNAILFFMLALVVLADITIIVINFSKPKKEREFFQLMIFILIFALGTMVYISNFTPLAESLKIAKLLQFSGIG